MRPLIAPSQPAVVTIGGDNGSAFPALAPTGGGGWTTPGAWTEVVAALPYDIAGWVVTASPDTSTPRYEFAVGASGSEVAIGPPYCANSRECRSVTYPIALDAGTRLSVRAIHSTSGAWPLRVDLIPANRAVGYRRWTVYGHTGWTDPDGLPGLAINTVVSSYTYGPWIEVAAALPHRVRQIVLHAVAPNTGSSYTRFLLDVGVGASGSEVAVSEQNVLIRSGATMRSNGYLLIGCEIPAGERLSVRYQSNTSNLNNSNQLLWLAVGD